ncbi:MAG: MerR family DNA-binding transcriptional regulator [Proteobacteria bacterium]|nr:MerR family DNA-binding transcriptional regulator [Pseudomonadota bacterium]
MDHLDTYVTIREAAKMLGVCEATLRRWDKLGKLKAVRHPINGYRLYKVDSLKTLIRTATSHG